MSKFLNISTDTTLGGNSASDDTVSSQKAVKAYVDSQTGTAPAFANITGQPTDNENLATALNGKQDTLVSGTNIKTINNTSILGSGNIDIQGGSSYTAGTGINITNDVISVEGVKDQRKKTTAIKIWTGTLAQYNAIATKDNNTLYNITDDMQASTYEAYSKSETDNLISTALNNTLSTLYPVGSIYIGTQSTCPLATLISGSTWVKVSEGRVLQGSDSNHNAGTTIAAGLPNITGKLNDYVMTTRGSGNPNFSGSLYTDSWASNKYRGNNSNTTETRIVLDASHSSSIYGNSNTVQPPAYVVNIWKRTA